MIRSAALATIACWFVVTSASGQTADVSGVIRDAASGEELVGVNVLVVGTALGATSDLDGRYTVRNVPEAPFDLRFSFVGFSPSIISGVRVAPGQTLKLDVNLKPGEIEGDEVVVTAERQLNTESSMLALRRKAATIGDAVSMEQVKRSPDATSGDALKRITGVTVFDNKFVYVRGVTDRYNSATLNGVPVTSTDTDADKKSFAFDMIPANLLENMTVTKTATPDLPGDFTGGLVQLNTLDFPERRMLKVSISTSSNSITSGKTVYTSQGAAQDWLGFDNGYRDFPGDRVDLLYDLARTLPDNWKLRQERAPLNGNFSLSLGDRLTVSEDDVLGYVGGLSYRNGYQRTEGTWNWFNTFNTPLLIGEGGRDVYSVLWGGLLNMSLQLGQLHKLTVNNNFNQSGEDKVTHSEYLDDTDESNIVEIAEWDQRSSYVSQVAGSHRLPAVGDMDVQWRAAYSSSIAREPDRRSAVVARPSNTPASYPYAFERGIRHWSNLREYTRSFGADFLLPLGEDSRFKFGGLAEGKSRQFNIRFFEIDGSAVDFGAHPNLYYLGLDSIFAPENFGPGLFFMRELSSPRDLYSGTQTVYAAYAMFDQRFVLLEQNLRFVAGARMENSEQLVNTISPFATNEPFIARVKNIDVLPSANLTWMVTEAANLRLAYSQSVNRPEFRELSAFYFYDYNLFEGTFGNPLLRRALSRNYDARFEVFPEPGEVLAVSAFYKGVTNAIEVKILPSTNPERTWFNSPKGKNYGWELEARKSFGFIADYLQNLSVGVNYARVFSTIEYEEGYKVDSAGVYLDRFRTETREMQGQSPWTINVSVTFTEPTLGTTLSLLYNEFGERVYAVGDKRYLDVIELPHGILDVSVTQPVVSGLELKFSVKDLNAREKEFRTREGRPYRTLFQGTTYGLQASFSL